MRVALFFADLTNSYEFNGKFVSIVFDSLMEAYLTVAIPQKQYKKFTSFFFIHEIKWILPLNPISFKQTFLQQFAVKILLWIIMRSRKLSTFLRF